MSKNKKLKLDDLQVQSFVTGVDRETQGNYGGLAALTPNCETNNEPRCWSPLCMTVPSPCTEGGPPCVDVIGVAVKN